MLSDEDIGALYAKHKDWWDFARAVERAVIERCAEVCAGISVDRWNQYKGREPYGPACSGRADPGIQGQSMGADDCELAIRSMLEDKTND